MSKQNVLAIMLLSGCALDELPGDELPGDELSELEHELSASRGDDIAVVGSTAANAGLLVAFTNDDGTFAVTNTYAGGFVDLAKAPGVKRVSGDFNRDGRMDFALLGGFNWTSIPLALSNGDGTFTFTNTSVGAEFNNWVRTANVTPLVGDYNKDGMSDIALTGAAGWASIPVAFSYGNGSFQITNQPSGLASYASMAGAKPLVGDFNKDGYSDIAVIGMGGYPFIPISFAAGGGSWQLTVQFAGSFNTWASTASVKTLVGDYNRDGYTDIALTGVAGWNTIPVASSAGGGSFIVTNSYVGDFGAWASTANVTPLVGDFNADGFSDIVLVGGVGWGSMPIAMSINGGAFQISNPTAGHYGAFAALASTAGARPLAGDFNADGYTDIALTGPSSWSTIPVASVGWPGWTYWNNFVSQVPQLTGEAGVTIAVGRVN